jgi:hypothetical protein
MSGKNFENKVQQKMDELRLPPSPQVWEQVERRIREKKRRRVLVFWFLLAGLLLTGGVIVYRQMNSDLPTQAALENAAGNQENNSPEENNLKEDNSLTTQTQSEKKNTATLNKINTAGNPEEKKVIVSDNIEKNKTAISVQGRKEIRKTEKKNKENAQKIKTEQVSIAIAITPADPEKKNKDDLTADKRTIEPAKEKQAEGISVISGKTDLKKDINDEVKMIEEKKPEETKPEIKTDEPVAKKEDKAKKNKWEIGVNGGFGPARLTNGSITSFGDKSRADAFSASNSGTSANPAPVSLADSIPLKGVAWQLGIYAKRKLGKKTAISFGLNLSAYSTKQSIGAFFDSVFTINNDLRTQTSEGVYRAGSFSSFRNKYYYLMVPVLLHWQFNRGDKLPPLVWENGLAPSFLVTSKALVYDKSSNLFYKDKRVYNSFNLVYQTGLSARLFKDKKHPLKAGVYYSYHISMLQKVAPPDYNYLSSYGLKLNWVIKK